MNLSWVKLSSSPDGPLIDASGHPSNPVLKQI